MDIPILYTQAWCDL